MAWWSQAFWREGDVAAGSPSTADEGAPSIFDRPVRANVRRSRARAACAWAAFAAGCWLAREGWAPDARWCFGVAGLFAAMAALAPRRAGGPALALALLCIGAGWCSLRLWTLDRDSLDRVIEERAGIAAAMDRVPASVEGIVAENPRRLSSERGGLRRFLRREDLSVFPLRARRLLVDGEWIEVAGLVRVWVEGAAPVVRAGESVRVSGLYAPPRGPRNPGDFDGRLASWQDGIVGSMSLTSASLVLRVEPEWHGNVDAARSAWYGFRAMLRARAARAVDSMLGDPAHGAPSEGAALVRGLLLGELEASEDGLRATFTRLGLLHALTISGFHLAVMALVCLAIVRLTGDRGWVEPVLVALLVGAYTLVVPAEAPVVRSALMVLLLLGGEAFGRRYDRLVLLFWIGLMVLVFWPLELWSLGYQLTFGMTAMLYGVAPAFESRVFGPRIRGVMTRQEGAKHRLGALVRQAMAINIACWTASMPAVLFRVGLMSPIGMLAGLLVGPLIVVVLWLGYMALLLAMVWPALGGVLGVPVRLVAGWTTRVAEALDRVPLGSMRLPPVSLGWTIVATLLAVAMLRWHNPRRAAAWIGAFALALWLGIEWSATGLAGPVRVRVDMMSVGNGSCVLVRSGDDGVLWDAGSLSAGLDGRELSRSLRALGVWRIPSVVVTHPDIDHFGLLPELTGPLGIREVIVGERFVGQAASEPGGAAACLLQELSRQGVAVRTGAKGLRLALGECELTFISPASGAGYVHDNEHSLMARVDRADAGAESRALVLLTGDAGGAVIPDIAREMPGLRTRVLELPHHGSADAGTIAWVDGLGPEVVLQSTSASRLDDPRWASTRAGRAWLVTARDGACWAEIFDDGTIRSGRHD